ncbi:hypothetical protein [Anabaena catenula]|uniref:Uncharacterized protein n=1 Tax=Anabaena catenula FACHB-362 TaxID=2692877 RepID=A0ABR8J5W3_9NOST|nr:hypothetical protein [Anabaena catenula]MBD2692854.1 hypothetical protein [Anabaena catenula FACHB-362]
MNAYKTYITIDDTKQIILSDLPFTPGQRLEVIILTEDSKGEVNVDSQDEKRKQFLLAANKAYAELRNNPELWQDELAERELWEQTLNDGLEEF